ncbi:MAG: hypothetical protein EXS13_01405 [Planctomycetes bacterium]|nr:hypothetical protein [Planctomycetota bacterium]
MLFGLAVLALVAGLARLYSGTVATQYRLSSASVLLDMNGADAAALERLPGIHAVLAERIVAERAVGGFFAGFADLSERVDGLAPRLARTLYGLVAFGQ